MAPIRPDENSPRYAGWRVVSGCFLLALFLFGFSLYSQGIYLVQLQRLNGWPASLVSGASTLAFLLGNFFANFTNELVTRLGVRRVVVLGIAALAGSTTLLAFASAPWMLYAAFVLMSFGWIGMGTVIIATVVSLWFVRRRGLAISLAFTGASSGGVVLTPLLVLLVEQLGFRAALLTTTAIMLVVLLPVTAAWIGAPTAAHPGGTQADDRPQYPARAALEGVSRLELVRRLSFWTISIPFSLAMLAQVGFIVHQIAMLEPKIGQVRAGFAVALMTFMAIIGRLALGAVIDRLNPRLVTAVSLVSQAGALLTILQTDNAAMVLGACAVFGLSVGNLITLPPLIIIREFDAASFTVVMGLSSAISGTVCALGPGLLGLVQSWRGDYDAAFLLCVALELVAAAIVVQRGSPAWQSSSAHGGG